MSKTNLSEESGAAHSDPASPWDRPYGFGTAESGRNGIAIIIFGLVVTTTTALVAPHDVLSRVGFLSAYVNLLSGVVPSINALAPVSSFPEVTRLVLAVTWTCAPIQTLLLLWSRTARFDLDSLR